MSDTIQVRTDEGFDRERLAAYIKEYLAALPVEHERFSVRQFGGGMANLTYELDFGSQKLVLRRPPLGPVAAAAHDMSREFQVLSVLYRAFDLAPRAFLYCDDEEVIGAPFFIMERRYGVVVRQEIPAGFGDDPTAPRRMSEGLVDALADLHAVDYRAVGLQSLGRPAGFLTRQIDGWYRRWLAAREAELEEMDQVFDWLKEHEPLVQDTALVHNDYKLDNVLLDQADPGHLVAVFDWDMCTLGDPLSDLGALLTYWYDPDDPPYLKALASTFMPVGTTGFLSRRALVERYAKRSGRDVREIDFYHTLGLFRLTVIIAQIYIRFVRGQTKDARFAALGEMIPLLVKAARNVALGSKKL